MRQTAGWVSLLEIAELSNPGVHYRLKQAVAFLAALVGQLLAAKTPGANLRWPGQRCVWPTAPASANPPANGRTGASTACSISQAAGFRISAASTTTSGRRGNPASSSRWRHARHSCAMPITASRLHAQARLLAQSDRDLVLDPGPQTPPPRQLHLQATSAAADSELHRLLQCHHGKAVPLDDERQTANGLTCQSGLGC